MLDLVAAGESFDDLIFYGLARLPRAGRELRTPSFSRSSGGGALITAVAAARLGLRCAVMSALSADSARLLRAEGVSLTNLHRHDEPCALTVALSTPTDRRFVTFEGVNRQLATRIRSALPRVRARHVHFAFVPRPCRPWIAEVRRLQRRGTTTSWDFGWDDGVATDPAFRALASAVDVLFVNRAEAVRYARQRTLRAALARWRQASNVVVVKLGAAGSRAVGDGLDVRAGATAVRRVVDTTGAGDAFNGAFLAALLRGRSLRQALASGNRTGALATRTPGGIAGLPRTRRRS